MKKTIQFFYKTWDQIRVSYLRLKTRYRKVILPLMAKCTPLPGGYWKGYFEVSK